MPYIIMFWSFISKLTPGVNAAWISNCNPGQDSGKAADTLAGVILNVGGSATSLTDCQSKCESYSGGCTVIGYNHSA